MTTTNSKRQATLEALENIPQGIWDAYLYAIRGVNLTMGRFILDDPTPCVELETAIALELGEERPS